jgi:hypothetical protein
MGRGTIVHQYMPELLQVLEHFRMASPLSPYVWVLVQRCFGGSDHRGIYHSILVRDAPCKPWHGGSTKII